MNHAADGLLMPLAVLVLATVPVPVLGAIAHTELIASQTRGK